jgi:hypothetical protein
MTSSVNLLHRLIQVTLGVAILLIVVEMVVLTEAGPVGAEPGEFGYKIRDDSMF